MRWLIGPQSKGLYTSERNTKTMTAYCSKNCGTKITRVETPWMRKNGIVCPACKKKRLREAHVRKKAADGLISPDGKNYRPY
jgi:DNA-directed RNA polymerase subunit RPC12/RpoP